MPGSFRGVLYELHLSWNLSSKTIRHFSVDKWQLHFTDDTTNAWTLTNNFSVRWNNWSWHFYTWMVVLVFDMVIQNYWKLLTCQFIQPNDGKNSLHVQQYIKFNSTLVFPTVLKFFSFSCIANNGKLFFHQTFCNSM